MGCTDGGFRKSVNGGFLFSAARGTWGERPVADIAMSPSYADGRQHPDRQGVAQARLSTDGGSSFSRLGSSGEAGSGATQVAFHS